MYVISLPRRMGKTTILVRKSAENVIPIICATQQHKKAVERCAKEMKLVIPQPFTVFDILRGVHKGMGYREFYIDELDTFLFILLGGEVKLATYTPK